MRKPLDGSNRIIMAVLLGNFTQTRLASTAIKRMSGELQQAGDKHIEFWLEVEEERDRLAAVDEPAMALPSSSLRIGCEGRCEGPDQKCGFSSCSPIAWEWSVAKELDMSNFKAIFCL